MDKLHFLRMTLNILGGYPVWISFVVILQISTPDSRYPVGAQNILDLSGLILTYPTMTYQTYPLRPSSQMQGVGVGAGAGRLGVHNRIRAGQRAKFKR